MLISFSVRNYRTFRERVEWSLIASADKTSEDDNVVELPAFGLRLLKSAVIYGANASGKSKLLEAINYMRDFVEESSKNGQFGEATHIKPFLLNKNSSQSSSEFEIQFIYKNEFYRYGFEISSLRVEAEWLFLRTAKGVRNKQEIELFYRTKQLINFHSRQFGGITNGLVKNAAIRENALLLSVAAQFNQPRATLILEWFNELVFLAGHDVDWERSLTFIMLRNPASNKEIMRFLANADLDIESIIGSKEKSPIDDDIHDETGESLRNWSRKEYANAKTFHRVYNESHELVNFVEFSLMRDESTGTKRMFDLAGPIVTALAFGYPLVVDEMDARLHPNLVSKIVQLFNSKTTNPNNAQLLFNTHDTNLLTSGNFRRDQIWFTEKNRYGEATLYSLADFKTNQVRKDEDFEANYIRGKYGAVPYLGDFNALPQAAPDTAPAHAHEE